LSALIPSPTQGNILSVHALQSFSDVLLNRGENGEAKTLSFGGTRRVRVSPQAWNRSTRKMVRQELQKLGKNHVITTRNLPSQIAQLLAEDHGVDPALATAYGHAALEAAGIGTNEEGNGTTKVTLVVPQAAIADLTRVTAEHLGELRPFVDKLLVIFQLTAAKKVKGAEEPAMSMEEAKAIPMNITLDLKKQLRRALDSSGEVDLALFGRFIAELTEWSVPSAVHTGNAITVQEAHIDTDFFSLIDDVLEEAGVNASVHVQHSEFTSGTFYRNAYLDRAVLRKNLAQGFKDKSDPAIDLLQELAEDVFVQSFTKSVPKSKSTRTSSNTLPFFVAVTDSDHPVNGQGAFLKALPRNAEDVEERAVEDLIAYLDSVSVLAPIHGGVAFSPRVGGDFTIGGIALDRI